MRGDDQPAPIEVVGTHKRDIGGNPGDSNIDGISQVGVSPLEDELGNEGHPRSSESRPANVIGLDPPQERVVSERLDPQLHNGRKVTPKSMTQR